MSRTMHRMGAILILWWRFTLHIVIVQSKSVSEVFSHFNTATTLYSSDNYLKCIFDHHVIPTSTEVVSNLVKILHSVTTPVKIRATRRGFHTSAGFVCPGPRASTKKEYTNFKLNLDDGSPPSITILLHPMNGVIEVDANLHRLTVGAGMTQFDLVDVAEKHNMSIPAGVLSIYGNLTVSGVILASAHGSGLGTINSLGDLVTKVKWVNGKGEILVSDSATESGVQEMKALVGGLGLLGIVTEFTLQLEPPSRTVVETRNNLDDTNIVEDVMKMVEVETPHVIVRWRPDNGKYRAVMWREQQLMGGSDVDGDEDDEELLPAGDPAFYPNGRIVYHNAVENEVVESWGEHLAAWEADTMEESNISDELKAKTCAMGEAMLNVLFFRDEDGAVLEHATIPTNNAMLSVDCSPKCFYQVHHMGTITEFTIKISQPDDWVKDVKAIVEAELAEPQARLERRYGKENRIKRCLPPGCFWLRFSRGNHNLISTNAGTEDVVYVQWISLVSLFHPNALFKRAACTRTIL